MKKDNIKLNYKYKNWKELLKTLELNWTTNNKQRGRYLEDLTLSFEFHKEGNGFIFTAIKDLEARREDKREGNSGLKKGYKGNNAKGIYLPYSIPLLKDFLRRQQQKTVYISNLTLANNLGLINENYRTANTYKEKFDRFLYSNFAIENNALKRNIWYKIPTCIKNDVVISALKKLKELKYITFIETKIIERKVTGYSEDFKKDIEYNKLKNASKKELSIINKVEKEVAKEMGQDSIKDIENKIKFYKECTLKFKNIMEKQYFDENINRYWSGFKIDILKDIEHIENIGKIQYELNSIFISRVYKKFKSDVNKVKNKDTQELKKYEMEILDNSYLSECEKILNIILNLDCEDYKYDIFITEVKKRKIGLQNINWNNI